MNATSAVAGFVVVSLAALTVPAPAAAQGQAIERAFPAGGTVVLDLSAGEYAISGSSDDRIRVMWETKHNGQTAGVDVRVDSRAGRATIRTDGPMDGLEVRIQLPRRSAIEATLSAGELTIRGLEGSKDVRVRAGELDIQVGDRARYRRVDASVTVGELSARPFRSEQGGLFRSLHWNGSGEYDLRASLTVGEMKLTD